MPLQLRRGTQAELNAITPAEGELIYVVPTGLGGQKLYIGDGTTAGSALTPVTGYSNSEAKDAAAASLLGGTHKNISFNYNSTTKTLSATVDILTHETIEADAIDTAAVKDGSTIVLDVANARLFGSVTGDVVGSVFADNSTLLVDAVAGLIPASVISGTANINVVGNLTGYHIGDMKGSVFADDSGFIVDGVTGDIYVNVLHMGSAQITQAGGIIDVPSNTTIGGQPFRIRLSTDDSTTTSFNMNDEIKLIGDNGIDTLVDSGLIKIRNNGLIPTVAQTGESNPHYLTFLDTFNGVGRIRSDGNLRYTPSSETLSVSSIIAGVDINSPDIATTVLTTGEIIANNILEITALLNTGTTRHLVQVGSNATSGRLRVLQNGYNNLSQVVFDQYHDTVDVDDLRFNRGRGTSLVTNAVLSGDNISDISFGGYDGTAMRLSAGISALVGGAVSAGVVPGELEFKTTNNSGVYLDAVTINSSQQTLFYGAIRLATYADAAARNTAIPSPTAGMMVYITSTGKFQGYNGLTSTWNDLN